MLHQPTYARTLQAYSRYTFVKDLMDLDIKGYSGDQSCANPKTMSVKLVGLATKPAVWDSFTAGLWGFAQSRAGIPQGLDD